MANAKKSTDPDDEGTFTPSSASPAPAHEDAQPAKPGDLAKLIDTLPRYCVLKNGEVEARPDGDYLRRSDLLKALDG